MALDIACSSGCLFRPPQAAQPSWEAAVLARHDPTWQHPALLARLTTPMPPAADSGRITIGDRTNIQDGTIIRTGATYLHDHVADTVIGSDVTIGHLASLHGVTVEDEAMIGMGATLQQGSTVQRGAVVAAGAVVAPGTTVPEGEIWGGNPAKFLRKLKPKEAAFLKESATSYVQVGQGAGGEVGSAVGWLMAWLAVRRAGQSTCEWLPPNWA